VLQQVLEAAVGEDPKAASRDCSPRRDGIQGLSQVRRQLHEAIERRDSATGSRFCRKQGTPDEEISRSDGNGGIARPAPHPTPIALRIVNRVAHFEIANVILDEKAPECRQVEGSAFQGRRCGDEEEGGKTLAAAPRIGSGVGQDETLGGLPDGAMKEATRLEEAILARW
jgi:hypothetical protein